jgi:hypothetical protein
MVAGAAPVPGAGLGPELGRGRAGREGHGAPSSRSARWLYSKQHRVQDVVLVKVGAHVPAVYVRGDALTLPTVEPDEIVLKHPPLSDDTDTEPSESAQAVSLYAVTVVAHESPAGAPQEQVHN